MLGRPYFREKFGDLQRDLEQVQQKLVQISAGPVLSETELRVVDRDPDDNKVLECAVDGDADVIVSGDSHLLELRASR